MTSSKLLSLSAGETDGNEMKSITRFLPSKNIKLLKRLLGKKIVRVSRQLFRDDMAYEDYEQAADGPVQFSFDDGTTIHVVALTEQISVGIAKGEMDVYGDSYFYADVTDNDFWKPRLNQAICHISLLQLEDADARYPGEVAIEFEFQNGKKAVMEYLNDEECPDMIRVAARYDGPPKGYLNLGPGIRL